MQLSIVTPVNNEDSILVKNAFKIAVYLEAQGIAYEHILVENGSRDNTLALARMLSQRDPRVRVIELPRRSLGRSMRAGFMAAFGEFVTCYPIDMAITLDFIPQSLEAIKEYDAVIGSKSHPDSDVTRPLFRIVASKSYGVLANLLLDEKIPDTQCVKTFRREVLQAIVPDVWNDDINFELALYYHAKKRGVRMLEYPRQGKRHPTGLQDSSVGFSGESGPTALAGFSASTTVSLKRQRPQNGLLLTLVTPHWSHIKERSGDSEGGIRFCFRSFSRCDRLLNDHSPTAGDCMK